MDPEGLGERKWKRKIWMDGFYYTLASYYGIATFLHRGHFGIFYIFFFSSSIPKRLFFSFFLHSS